MKSDIVVAGVGGQGILTIAFLVDNAALKLGLHFKQSEVHGMSQRGGAVQSFLRVSDQEIHSDLVPLGSADILLAVEPLEALRYVEFLAPAGLVVSSINPFENITDYPDVEKILDAVSALGRHILVDAERLAKAAGSGRAENVVMIGATAAHLPFPAEIYREFLTQLFARKGQRIVDANLRAFEFGQRAGRMYDEFVAAGLTPRQVRVLARKLDFSVDPSLARDRWVEALRGPSGEVLLAGLAENPRAVPATLALAERLLSLHSPGKPEVAAALQS